MGISFFVESPTQYSPTQGLYLANDDTPTSSTLASQPDMIDGDYLTANSKGYWQGGKHSYGFDLGSSKLVKVIKIYGITASGQFVGYFNPSWKTFDMYSSNDNSTWSLVQTYDGPPFDQDRLGAPSTGVDITFTLTNETTARYFKIRNTGLGVAFSPGGASWRPSELNVWRITI